MILSAPTRAAVLTKKRLAWIALVLLMIFSSPARGFGQSLPLSTKPFASRSEIPTRLAIQSGAANDTLHLIVGHSVVLTATAPLSRIYIANPAILDSYTSGASEIVLTAKTLGVSSIVLWEKSGGHRLYTVSADLDVDALRRSLDAAYPTYAIRAETGEGKVYLTGIVPTEAAYEGAAKIALLYGKEVVNSLRVVAPHLKQVQLKLRIVEVDRTRLEQFGVNLFAGGRTAVGATTQQFNSVASGSGASLSVSNPLNIFLYNAKLNVGLTIEDLEQKQVLQILAEPTLTSVSGMPAHFLSGGEFPFPVAQGSSTGATAITIQFRPYGVKMDFTPTVYDDGTIHIKIVPEVSALDYSNAVTISGFTIPALSTRRAETEVEIQDGQSFMLSGILDHRTTEILSKVPGLGSLPVLGPLFRSKNINHSVIDLVVIVTASVVDPLVVVSTKHLPNEPKFVVPNLNQDTFDDSTRGRYRQDVPEAGNKKPQPVVEPQ